MAAQKKYTLTPEHRAQLEPWKNRWIANAMATSQGGYTDAQRTRARAAIKGLYRAANLKPPPDERIVFVPSPFVLRFAAGFAAAIWYLRTTGSDAATSAATEDATRDATYAATSDATSAATDTATSANDLWYPDLSAPMLAAAKAIGGDHAKFLLACAPLVYGRAWNGGNQWSGWVAFLSFFRHVAKLDLEYEKWDHYETLADYGPRVLHAEFAMISELPTVLTVDAGNQPHNETGPFCAWRDGTALYSIHGVRVPRSVVEHPERLTLARIEAEHNAEIKRIMIDRYGLGRYVRDSRFEVVDADVDPLGQPRRLLRRDGLTVVELANSTEDGDGSRRMYHVPVEPSLRPMHPDGTLGEPQAMTALNAVASTYGLRGEQYALELET